MIRQETRLTVADNSGARELKAIRVINKQSSRTAGVGDVIVCSVQQATPRAELKRGDVVHAVVVRTSAPIQRKDGTRVRFDDNAAVIIDPQTENPRGTRVFGPVSRELRQEGFMKIVSLAPEVL